MSEMDKFRSIAASVANYRSASTPDEERLGIEMIKKIGDFLGGMARACGTQRTVAALAYVVANGLSRNQVDQFDQSLTVALQLRIEREARNGKR